jgi:autoinducer 2-degrading protein
MICVAVTYVILPNREEEAIDLFTSMTEATLQEPGCRMYQVHRSRQEPRRFFLYEQYDDEKALEAHRRARTSSSTCSAGFSASSRAARRTPGFPSSSRASGR